MAHPATLLVETTTHGRVLVDAPPGAGPHPVLLGFHGYAENATHILAALSRLDPSHAWLRVAAQGLHRFYARGGGVVASWMTSEDRDQAIADNLAYGRAIHAAVARGFATRAPLVVAGFSQGAAQAYRTAIALGTACHGIIALGGDIPPDVAPVAAALPPVLIGRGATDTFYTAETFAKDEAALRGAAVRVATCAFDGGHEWADGFVDVARGFLARIAQPAG